MSGETTSGAKSVVKCHGVGRCAHERVITVARLRELSTQTTGDGGHVAISQPESYERGLPDMDAARCVAKLEQKEKPYGYF